MWAHTKNEMYIAGDVQMQIHYTQRYALAFDTSHTQYYHFCLSVFMNDCGAYGLDPKPQNGQVNMQTLRPSDGRVVGEINFVKRIPDVSQWTHANSPSDILPPPRAEYAVRSCSA